MARDIGPAKRGDLVGHLAGERFECVTPLVRFLEGAGQIPPVESGRSIKERLDTDRIEKAKQPPPQQPPHKDTELGRPAAVEANRRPTQKQPQQQAPDRATKPVEPTTEHMTRPVGNVMPDRPTDSVFMDPVIMTDDSFFDDPGVQAELPTIIEPSLAQQAPPPTAPAARAGTRPPTDSVSKATAKVGTPGMPLAGTPTMKVSGPAEAPPARVPASAAPVVPLPSDTVFEAKPVDAELAPAPMLDDLSIEADLPSFNDEPAAEEDTDKVKKAVQDKPTTKVEPRTDVKSTTSRKPGEVVRDTVNFYNQTSSLKDILEQAMSEEPPPLKGGLPASGIVPAAVAPAANDFFASDEMPASLNDDEETAIAPAPAPVQIPTERVAQPEAALAPSVDDSFENAELEQADITRVDTVFDFTDKPAPATPVAKSAPAAPGAKVPAPRPEPAAELPVPDAVGGDFLANDELPSEAGDRIIPELLMTAPSTPPPPPSEIPALEGRTVALPPPPQRPPTRRRTEAAPVPAAAKKPSNRMPAVAPGRPKTAPVPAKPAYASLPEAKTEIGVPAQPVPAAAPAARTRAPLPQREAVRPPAAVSDSAETRIPQGPAKPAPAAASQRAAPRVPPAPKPAPEPVAVGGGSGETTVLVEPRREMLKTTDAVAKAAKPPAPSIAAPAQPVAAHAGTTIFDAPALEEAARNAAPLVPPAPLPQEEAAQPVEATQPQEAVAAKLPLATIEQTRARIAAVKQAAATDAAARKVTDAVEKKLRKDRADTMKLIESAEAVLARLNSLNFATPRRSVRAAPAVTEDPGRRAPVAVAAEALAPTAALASGTFDFGGGLRGVATSGDADAGARSSGTTTVGPPTRRIENRAGNLTMDELLLGAAPPPDFGGEPPRRHTTRAERAAPPDLGPPPSRRRPPGPPHDGLDVDEMLAAASASHFETESGRRRAISAAPPPSRDESTPATSGRKMTSVLAKELDGMLKQMAANSARLPQEPVQDKLAPRQAGASFLDGPLWQTLLGLAGMSAFITGLFILIWFFLAKGS